jgi:hypothetical protein
MDTCENGKSWQNWANTIEFTPTTLCQPTTFSELKQALESAQSQNLPVRVAGSGHSWSLGAVPGPQPYQQGANISAFLIELTNMNPKNSLRDPYLKANYFQDTSQNWYVAIPPGTGQGWLGENAANDPLNDPLHLHSNPHIPLALTSMGPAPDITLGGFVANGCHGTGWEQPPVGDFVQAVEVLTVNSSGTVVVQSYAVSSTVADAVNSSGAFKSKPTVSTTTMQALRASIGALGIITKIVLQVVPLFNVAHLDEIAELDGLFPSNGDTTNLQTLVTSTDYVEIFWFPFTTQLWVKRYSQSSSQPQFVDKVLGFTWITSVLAALTGNLLGDLFALIPRATPITMQVFWFFMKIFMGERTLQSYTFSQDFNATSDPIVPVQDAYLYQRMYFRNLLDLEYTVPIPQNNGGTFDFSGVMTAWNNAYNQVISMSNQNPPVYPVNISIHLRFIKNSDSFLSPANQENATTHTCYIEFLSFSQQCQQYQQYGQIVEPQWAALGGLPNWAKMIQVWSNAATDAHQKLQARGQLQPFLTCQKEMDPKGVFENNYLGQVLQGEQAAPVTICPAPAPKAALQPEPVALSAFAVENAQKWSQILGATSAPNLAQSPGGNLLAHHPGTGVAMLVDETGHGHYMDYRFDAAANQVRYTLLTESKLLAPRDIALRVEEVLRHAAQS